MDSRISTEDQKTILRWCLQSAAGLVGYAAIVFLSAGRLDWLWSWVFIGLTALFLASHVVLLVPINPDLFIERAGELRKEGGKRWDRGKFPIVMFVIRGLFTGKSD